MEVVWNMSQLRLRIAILLRGIVIVDMLVTGGWQDRLTLLRFNCGFVEALVFSETA